MKLYNVHLYREIRLTFRGIEADTPQAAAAIARDGLTSDADDIDDYAGDDFAALVDLVDDHKFEHSVTIEFKAERLRKAAPALLRATRSLIGLVHQLLPAHAQSDSTLDNLPEVIRARAAITQATTQRNQRRRIP
jgi:hypothetical protein